MEALIKILIVIFATAVIYPLLGMLVVGLWARITNHDIHWPKDSVDRRVHDDSGLIVFLVFIWPIALVAAIVFVPGRFLWNHFQKIPHGAGRGISRYYRWTTKQITRVSESGENDQKKNRWT